MCALKVTKQKQNSTEPSLHTEKCHDSMALNLFKQKVLKRPPW